MAVSGLVDADQFLSKMADLPIPDGLSLKGGFNPSLLIHVYL